MENNISVLSLNELEYVNSYIYANTYTINKIVKIECKTEILVKMIDFMSFCNDAKSKIVNLLEMNGIAYINITDAF